MTKKSSQKNDVQVVNLIRQGIFEDEVADLVLEKVFAMPEFEPVLNNYKQGKIDEFEFVDLIWQKFNEGLK